MLIVSGPLLNEGPHIALHNGHQVHMLFVIQILLLLNLSKWVIQCRLSLTLRQILRTLVHHSWYHRERLTSNCYICSWCRFKAFLWTSLGLSMSFPSDKVWHEGIALFADIARVWIPEESGSLVEKVGRNIRTVRKMLQQVNWLLTEGTKHWWVTLLLHLFAQLKIYL